MTRTVDAQGLACPQPVILTRNALRESDVVITIVDNETALHNVTRMAEKSGAIVRTEERVDGIYLQITQEDTPLEEIIPQVTGASEAGPLVVTIPSEIMGRGDAELGHILIRGFFHALGEVEPLPDTIIFFNSGVKLVTQGSAVLEDLQGLCERDVEILACGTCLGHYELKDKVAIGEISNMYTIVETLLGAGKVIGL
jgi:selenium metabolism protein YedF